MLRTPRDSPQVFVVLNKELDKTSEKGSEVLHLKIENGGVRPAGQEWTTEQGLAVAPSP